MIGRAILGLLCCLAAACAGEPATPEACQEILDRIVEIELGTRGFRDPELLARKRQEMRRRFHSALKSCVGKRLPPGALFCVRLAKRTEELSHRCLK